MIRPLTVKGVQIGCGKPKIIVPIVGKTHAEIIGKAQSFAGQRIDMVEWRADFYQQVFDTGQVLFTLAALRAALPATPVLFTFRSKKEGGERDISPANYTALNKAVAESGQADLVDVEIYCGDEVARQNIALIHAVGVLVVGSNHDFCATPPVAEMVARLRKMQELGADIAKIAVMPTCRADVLALPSATAQMHEQYADRPIITMSMSALGVVSRLSGELFGSAATFGAAGQNSAPGQIPVEQLARALDILHNAL